MMKLVLSLFCILCAGNAVAMDVSDLDRELRSSTSKSIMFRRNNIDDEEERMREQAEA